MSPKEIFMLRNRIFLLVVFFAFFLMNTTFAAVDRFGEANQLYRDGKYDEAAKIYEEMVKSKPASEVYYNLGNAYFKAKKLGLSILNYERARRMEPRDSDVLSNLTHAHRLIEYRIEDKRNWYVRKLSELVRLVTLQECWALVLSTYFVFTVSILISLIRRQPMALGKGRTFLLGLVMLSSLPLLLKFLESGTGRRGIVTETQAEVRYGPSSMDRIAFRLVEGLEVSLNDEKQDWYRIELKDGRSGWVPQSQVTTI